MLSLRFSELHSPRRILWAVPIPVTGYLSTHSVFSDTLATWHSWIRSNSSGDELRCCIWVQMPTISFSLQSLRLYVWAKPIYFFKVSPSWVLYLNMVLETRNYQVLPRVAVSETQQWTQTWARGKSLVVDNTIILIFFSSSSSLPSFPFSFSFFLLNSVRWKLEFTKLKILTEYL